MIWNETEKAKQKDKERQQWVTYFLRFCSEKPQALLEVFLYSFLMIFFVLLYLCCSVIFRLFKLLTCLSNWYAPYHSSLWRSGWCAWSRQVAGSCQIRAGGRNNSWGSWSLSLCTRWFRYVTLQNTHPVNKNCTEIITKDTGQKNCCVWGATSVQISTRPLLRPLTCRFRVLPQWRIIHR